MSFMPFHMPRLWLRGLLAAAPLAVGAYCLAKSFQRRRVAVKRPPDEPVGEDAAVEERTVVAPWRLGLNRETGLLVTAVGLIGWSVGGGRAYALSRRREKGTKPRDGEDRRLRRPDGTELHVETYGRKDGAPSSSSTASVPTATNGSRSANGSPAVTASSTGTWPASANRRRRATAIGAWSGRPPT